MVSLDYQQERTAVDSSANTSRGHQGVQVSITRVGDRRLRAQVGSCVVEIEQWEPPNEHNGRVVSSPPQVCTIAVEGFNGPMTTAGDVLFDQVNNTLTLTGAPQDRNIGGSYGYSFDGRRQP